MHKVKELKIKLQEMNHEVKQKNIELRKQGFEDESLFEKIKSNVYEIFLQVMPVAVRKGDFESVFQQFLDTIPENWYKALEKAKAEEDFEQEHIEKIKIETKIKIEALFVEVFKS